MVVRVLFGGRASGHPHAVKGRLVVDAPKGRGVDGVALRHGDRGVPEPLLELHERHPVLRAVYRVGVAEVVEADLRDSGLLSDPVPRLA